MRATILLLGATALALSAAQGTVTDKHLAINGADTVPSGLFGVHHVPLTPERMAAWNIDSNRFITHGPNGRPVLLGKSSKAPAGIEILLECFYDRFQPALTVTKPGKWKDFLTGLGERYGANATGSGQTHYIEFWNEPYLNWATKPGVNYDPRYYKTDGITAGDPVFLKGSDEPTGMIWKPGRWYKALKKVGDISGTYSTIGIGPLYRMLLRAKAGDKLSWGGREIEAVDRLMPHDPEQPSWWSGGFNRRQYIPMFQALAEGLAKTNSGNVKLLAGWGFHIHQDWPKAWELIHKPTIDACIQQLDGYHEHHYGGDTREVAADYEMVQAYVDRVHGKRIQFFNTECGANYDSQRPDRWKTSDEKWFESAYANEKERRIRIAFGYMVRDIVHMIDVCPDKGVFRVSHDAHRNGGTPHAFELLKNLRGTLVACHSSDPDVWIVASRPSPDRLTIVAYNDARDNRDVVIALPQGTTSITQVTPVFGDESMTLQYADSRSGETAGDTARATIEPHSAVAWDCVTPEFTTNRSVTQHFADGIIQAIPSEGQLTMPVDFGDEDLETVSGAVIKLVQTGVSTDHKATVSIGDHSIKLPQRSFTVRLPLEVKYLRQTTPLLFTADKPGITIRMASIELIRD